MARTRHASPPETDVLRLGMGLPLPELTPFLNRRIDTMLETGALDEARAAMKKNPDLSLPGWSGIGCRELGEYLAGNRDLTETLELWRKNTKGLCQTPVDLVPGRRTHQMGSARAIPTLPAS